MEKLFQSVALIPELANGYTKFLLNQAKSSQLEFIVADRLGRESFRESVTREVAWQLDLDRSSEFLVSNMAQISMEFVETTEDNHQRHMAVAFYNVYIFGRKVRERLTSQAECLWVSAAEVCNGRTTCGRDVHARVVEWINRWDVIQPWQ